MDEIFFQLESLDDLPESIDPRSFYTERDGKFVLKLDRPTAQKVSSFSRVFDERDRLKTSMDELSSKWGAFGERDPADIQAALDEVEELRAFKEAGGNKIDEEKLQSLVEARVSRETAPLKRQLEERIAAEKAAIEERDGLRSTLQKRDIHEEVTQKALKVCDERALSDVIRAADVFLTVADDGVVVTKEGRGVTPNVSVDTWLTEMLEKSPLWAKESKGVPGNGSKPGVGVPNNPFTAKNWSLQKQQEVYNTLGADKYNEMREAAGVKLGQTKPTKAA